MLWLLLSLFSDANTRALLSKTAAAAAAAPMVVRLLALDVCDDVMLPALSVMRTLMCCTQPLTTTPIFCSKLARSCRYKAAAIRQVVIENHGLRVLLRLLARPLPPPPSRSCLDA